MSSARTVRPSRMMAPSRPWPRGAAPIAARPSGEMPLVMNRSIRPVASATPSAEKRAPTRSRTRSTMTPSTRSMSSSAATARVAASSAARRFARPWTSARDQAASTTSSRPRTTGPLASSAASRNSRASVVCPSCEPSRYRASPVRSSSCGTAVSEPAPTMTVLSGGAQTSRMAPRAPATASTPSTWPRSTSSCRVDGSSCQRSRASSVAASGNGSSRAGVGRADGDIGREPTSPVPGAGRRSRGVRAKRPLRRNTMRAHHFPIVHPPQPGVPLPVEPTVHTQPDVASPAEPEENGATEGGLSRRGFLRVAGAVGLTGVAATVAACTTGAAPAWSFGAPAAAGAASAAPSTAPESQAPASVAPSASAARHPPARLRPLLPRPPPTSRPAGPSTTSPLATRSAGTSATSRRPSRTSTRRRCSSSSRPSSVSRTTTPSSR